MIGKDVKMGVIRDYGLTAGFDYNAKDDQFAPRVQKLFVGPTVSFDVPGFLNLSLLYMDEKNHNGEKGKNGFGADTKPETLIEAATPP